MDFDTYGLWYYNGSSWTSLAGWNPDSMVKWDSGIAVDFGPYGLWYYDGSGWTNLASWNPEEWKPGASSLPLILAVTDYRTMMVLPGQALQAGILRI